MDQAPPRDAVLVTRPEPGATATAARLSRMGLRPVLAPLLRIVKLPAALPDPDVLQAVLVTSANALPGLPDAYRRLPLLAVGAATAAQARAAGFGQVLSADGDATALLELCRGRCVPGAGTLLLATGHGQGEVLAAWLAQLRFVVARAVLYAALDVDTLADAAGAAWRDGTLRAALFFSADTARVFVRAASRAGPEHARTIEALAIGHTAAAALAPLPWRQVRVADRPTQDSMLALLT